MVDGEKEEWTSDYDSDHSDTWVSPKASDAPVDALMVNKVMSVKTKVGAADIDEL